MMKIFSSGASKFWRPLQFMALKAFSPAIKKHLQLSTPMIPLQIRFTWLGVVKTNYSLPGFRALFPRVP